MAAYNSATFMGNLGTDVTLRKTQTNRPVASFRIASNRSWKDDSGKKHDEVTWMDVTVWGAQAESCAKYLSKGAGVFVEGRLANTEWVDKENVRRFGVEIVARTVQFLPRGQGGGARAPHPADREAPSGGAGEPPDLPPPPEEPPGNSF